MSSQTPTGHADERADAVADPRDRRRGDRRSGRDRRADAAGEGATGTADRRRSTDRRQGDRRSAPDVPELYRGGKRSINEYPLTPDELEFINAVNGYKTKHGRPFPTWSEVLHVLRHLGYRKAAAPVTADPREPGE